ncbi:hypothetical protein M426DRAFT_149231 [Hypoxylon sp. CI-4A]|nr:hypothetical protein M426DRAFT_149231 [Hypoxylon sp. CI-4A]
MENNDHESRSGQGRVDGTGSVGEGVFRYPIMNTHHSLYDIRTAFCLRSFYTPRGLLIGLGSIVLNLFHGVLCFDVCNTL